MSVEQRYPQYTVEDSIRKKDWAAGSKEISDSIELLFTKSAAVYEKIRYPPQLLKIIDEPLVNAIDHVIRCIGSKHQVTRISVSLDKSGKVTIHNDGPGIEIAWHSVAKMYIPEFLLANVFQGTNVEKSDDCIIGGTNGIGAKLSIMFSTEYSIETASGGKLYRQTWRDCKRQRLDPTITDYKGTQYTQISFIPAYTLCYGYKSYDECREVMERIVYSRCVYASAYCGYIVDSFNMNSKPYTKNVVIAQKAVAVAWNGDTIGVKSITDIAKLTYPTSKIHSVWITPDVPAKADAKSAAYKYPWQVAMVTVADPICTSNVNGIVVKRGKHIDWIMSRLDGAVRDALGDKLKGMSLNTHLTASNVSIFLNAQIPNPNWTGQTKEEIKIDSKLLCKYIIDEKTLKPIVAYLKDIFMTSAKAAKQKKKVADYDKYTAAKHAKSSKLDKRLKCALLLPEGDSAATNIGQIITGGAGGYEYYGMLTLGGVIMNIARSIKEYVVAGKKQLKLDAKVYNNKFWSVFFDVTGLNPDYRYDPQSPSYTNEIAGLRYGSCIVCVDQDLDGNNICGLILAAFNTLWPALLKAGYVQKFSLPLIRCYPTKSGPFVEEFYSEYEYNEWAKGVDISKWNVRYYKGIAGHNSAEIRNASKDFKSKLRKFTAADMSTFDIYYGDDAEKRKIELAKPPAKPTPELVKAQREQALIKCDDFLKIDVNAYQQDNIKRHLLHILDGMNQAGRKILNGLVRHYRSNGASREKIAQLAGMIAQSQNYHHGEQTLANTITSKGFAAVGGVQLPQIAPDGQFGTRMLGGDDAGASRYIYGKFNHRCMLNMYPMDDYWLLPFTFEEGERFEPDYFLPILPAVILEHYTSPATGWASFVWGRDLLATADVVKRMIDYPIYIGELPLARCNWKGKYFTFGGKTYTQGAYEYDAKTRRLTITELPLKTWTIPYVNYLRERNEKEQFADSIERQWSDDKRVHISMRLTKGLYDELIAQGSMFDGIIKYFELYSTHNDCLAMYCEDDTVKVFQSYSACIKHWFPHRQQMYTKRIERNTLLLTLKIKMLQNTIRYITEFEKIFTVKISTLDDDALDKTLQAAGFNKFAKAKLERPEFANIAEIAAFCDGPLANYNYLLDAITERGKTAVSLAKLKKRLGDLEDELIEYTKLAGGKFPGAEMWKLEIDKLVAAYKDGVATEWMYDEKSLTKFR